MRDLVNSLYENDMKLEIPAEYAEYLHTQPEKIVYHDPENDEHAAIASKVKMKTAAFLVICAVVLLLLFVYVIVTKSRKTQVVTGRAVIKTKQREAGKQKTYHCYVSVAVDEPVKTIYSRIPVSESDYEKIQEGTPIMIVNVSSPGKGVVLD